jgi:hypothetical protein
VQEIAEAAASSEPDADALERLILDLAGIVARYPLLATLIGKHQGPKDHGPPERLVETFDSLADRGRRDGTLRPDLRGEILGPVTMGALVMSLKIGSLSGSDPHDVGAEVAAMVLGGARSAESRQARSTSRQRDARRDHRDLRLDHGVTLAVARKLVHPLETPSR